MINPTFLKRKIKKGVILGLGIFLSVLLLIIVIKTIQTDSPDSPDNPNQLTIPFVNIGDCVNPSYVEASNPSQPIIEAFWPQSQPQSLSWWQEEWWWEDPEHFWWEPPPPTDSPDSPNRPPVWGVNIGVCVNPPYVDVSNPLQPIFSWTTSGNPQKFYWLQVDDTSGFVSPEINTGPVLSGSHSFQTSPNQLVRKKTYWWRIAVRDAYGWTGWTGCTSFYLPGLPPSATNLRVTQPDYCRVGPSAIFSWDFTDPDPGDFQSAYRVQTDNNSDFSSPEDDSGKVISRSNSYATPLGKLSYNTTYYWRLMVWDSDNLASNWISGPSFTTPRHAYPTIDFDWVRKTPTVNEIVQFTDQSTVYGGATKMSWFWTFQGGSPGSSNQQNPAVSFISSGPKEVTLRITDSSGFTCTDSRTVNVAHPLPEWREVAP